MIVFYRVHQGIKFHHPRVVMKVGGGGQYKTTEGGLYGRKYGRKYKDIIRELYKRGNKGSSNKINNITFVITVYF